ncbi:MAG: cell division FtsA domain-containing protein, partial [Bacteroidales bacterium]|nr:cell division FtsA domain-containing protein [Bacteroidales bacterium]
KFGSALANENKDEEIVAIPGLRGRPPKEISLKNLASIIQARIEELIEHIYFEIKNSGYDKKLIAGIVLTGGGALLRHVAQLTEFMTGMDTRIGYPNEHLTNNTPEEMSSPMYATGIGLVIEGLERVEMKMRREEKAMVGTNMEKKSKAAEAKPKRQGSFLKKIQDFFENDTE